MAKRAAIDPTADLRTTEERPIGVSVPIPVSRRLDRLVELAESAGLRVYRKDLVAALVLASTDDPQELSKLVLQYRTAKAGDAQVAGEPKAAVLHLARSKPGRRPRRN